MGIFNCCRPKYDVQYCACTNCSSRHPFNRGKREHCQKVQRAANAVCGPLASWGPQGFTLYYDCLKFVNGNPEKYDSAKDYACGEIGGEALFYTYGGLTPCSDFTPHDTVEGELYAQQQGEEDEAVASQQKVIGVLALAAVALLAILLFRD